MSLILILSAKHWLSESHQWTPDLFESLKAFRGLEPGWKLLSSFVQSPSVPSIYWFKFVWRSINRSVSHFLSLYLCREVDASIRWGCFQAGAFTAQSGPADSVKRLPACKWDGDVFVEMVNRLLLVLRQNSCSWKRGRRRKQQQRPGKQEAVHYC